MKLRFTRNGRSHARELVVSLRRNDAVSSRCLRWLLSSTHKNFLPFRYEHGRRAGSTMLFYDVTGLTSLKSFVRRTKLTVEGITRMLVSLAEALTFCVNGGNRFATMVFDPAYVFVGATCELHFVFVPIAESCIDKPGSPLVLLEMLGDAERLRFCSPNAAELSRHLSDFVLGEDGVFSLNSLRAFLRSSCKVEVSASGEAGAARRSTRQLLRASTGERFEVREGTTLRVGRSSACEVCVSGETGVSRNHACVCCERGDVYVWDVGSKNGTTYDGRRLTPNTRVRLCPGDTFYVDAVEFEIL